MSYIISGKTRREMKKQLHLKRRQVRMSYYLNDIDEVYGGGISLEDLEKYNQRLLLEIDMIEIFLNERI